MPSGIEQQNGVWAVGDPVVWSAIAALAAVAGVCVVIAAAVITLSQLRELVRARHVDAMFRVYDLIGSEAARDARRYVHVDLTAPPGEISTVDLDNIEKVAVTLDRVGALVSAGLVPEDELMASHAEVFLRTWSKLEPYLKQRGADLGLSPASYMPHYRELASRARQYRKRHPR